MLENVKNAKNVKKPWNMLEYVRKCQKTLENARQCQKMLQNVTKCQKTIENLQKMLEFARKCQKKLLNLWKIIRITNNELHQEARHVYSRPSMLSNSRHKKENIEHRAEISKQRTQNSAEEDPDWFE